MRAITRLLNEFDENGEGVPNPVVKETRLDAYPGWYVREYADGTFDAENDRALSPVEATFAAAVYFARHGEPAPASYREQRGDSPGNRTENGEQRLATPIRWLEGDR